MGREDTPEREKETGIRILPRCEHVQLLCVPGGVSPSSPEKKESMQGVQELKCVRSWSKKAWQACEPPIQLHNERKHKKIGSAFVSTSDVC